MSTALTGKVFSEGIAYKAAAIGTWFVGTYTTYRFLYQLNPNSPYWAAFALQALLTLTQRQIYHRRGVSPVSVGSFVFDTLLNATGIFLYIGNFNNTELWYFITTGTDTSFTLNALALFFLSLIGGAFLAAAPEFLWSESKK